ncbi:DinB family protein [Hymenobacter sp. BT175]|uniref:DinB family protein n=1 Tax=Hymenobacter translucens TaxID=2886507 RepID=UPI001D0DD66A|nr:DinB family protein [Hymenobacter translucens]MCC2547598.1 DinB family protein [Hymenobacter translucens]
MTKSEILPELTAAHAAFAATVSALSATDFVAAPAGKWSAGQQLDHIVRAVEPVGTALLLPRVALRLLFGRANRPSRSYEELVQRYQQKLAAGGKASGRFVPPVVGAARQSALGRKLEAAVARLVKRAAGYSEQDLDAFVLPHPLLGKLTLREMLYFTLYHVEHHHRQLPARAEA